MKFLMYVSLIVMIFAIFTSIEARDTDTEEWQRQMKRKRLPTARSSTASTFSRSSLGFQHSRSQRRQTKQNAASLGSSALSLDGLFDLPKKSKVGKAAPSKDYGRAPPNNSGPPSSKDYGRAPPNNSGPPRFVRGPVARIGRRGPFGYYNYGFPYWITSYAYVMYSIEECPAFHKGLEYGQKLDGMCMMLCDKAHCIQTINYCCYYVEPAKLLVVAAKK